GKISLLDLATGRKMHSLNGLSAYNWSLIFSPNGKVLASGGMSKDSDDIIKLWDTATGKELHVINDNHESKSLAFSPNGQILASGNSNGTIKIWDVNTGRELRTLKKHSSLVKSA